MKKRKVGRPRIGKKPLTSTERAERTRLAQKRAYTNLRKVARRALDLLKAMERDCAIRLPFNGFEDAKAELEQALGV